MNSINRFFDEKGIPIHKYIAINFGGDRSFYVFKEDELEDLFNLLEQDINRDLLAHEIIKTPDGYKCKEAYKKGYGRERIKVCNYTWYNSLHYIWYLKSEKCKNF